MPFDAGTISLIMSATRPQMVEALVFINVEIGREGEVIEELAKLDNVKDIWMVYGPYDVVARVVADTSEALRAVISDQIRRISTVRSTMTLIIASSIRKG